MAGLAEAVGFVAMVVFGSLAFAIASFFISFLSKTGVGGVALGLCAIAAGMFAVWCYGALNCQGYVEFFREFGIGSFLAISPLVIGLVTFSIGLKRAISFATQRGGSVAPKG